VEDPQDANEKGTMGEKLKKADYERKTAKKEEREPDPHCEKLNDRLGEWGRRARNG